jgi:hypothetical protein
MTNLNQDILKNENKIIALDEKKNMLEPLVMKVTRTVLRRVQKGNLLLLSDIKITFF